LGHVDVELNRIVSRDHFLAFYCKHVALSDDENSD